MIPEPVIAMLASGRLGAVHSVVSGGFALTTARRRSPPSTASSPTTD
jgi:acyl-coenzyme A synthetase/AMP-(fatty) acid ligase